MVLLSEKRLAEVLGYKIDESEEGFAFQYDELPVSRRVDKVENLEVMA